MGVVSQLNICQAACLFIHHRHGNFDSFIDPGCRGVDAQVVEADIQQIHVGEGADVGGASAVVGFDPFFGRVIGLISIYYFFR